MRLRRIVLFRDENGEYRWTLYASNGKIIAASTEGYKKYNSMKQNLMEVLHIAEIKKDLILEADIAMRLSAPKMHMTQLYAISSLKAYARIEDTT